MKTSKEAYNLVKSGEWTLGEFRIWTLSLAQESYDEGYDDAKSNYQDRAEGDAYDRMKMSGHG
jgi:hypothetical protein